jgi:hypothetical protein
VQRNAPAGNLRHYNETEVEVGLPLWLPGQRDAMAATVGAGTSPSGSLTERAESIARGNYH